MLDARVGRPILVLIVAFIVAIMGLLGGGSILISTIAPYLRARSWVSTNAKISYLGLETYKRGGRRSDIVRVRCIYTYLVDGRLYKGVNASMDQADPFKYYYSKLYKNLLQQKEAGTARAYYDAASPAFSVLTIKYSPGIFTSGILAVTITAGLGLIWITAAVVRLKSGLEMAKNPLEVRAEERDWPPSLVANCVLMIFLLIITLPVSIDSVVCGMNLSLMNVALGVIHFIIFTACAVKTRKSRNAGRLVLPSDEANSDACCVCIPSTWDGNCTMHMNVSWVKENHLLFLKPVGKPERLKPISLTIDPATQETRIVFKPAKLPPKLGACEIIAMRISGNIGTIPYEGTFLVGQLLIWRKYETRESLGLHMMGSSVL